MSSLETQKDFEAFIAEMQIDRDLMNAQVHDERDQVPFPPGPWPVEVRPSTLHGLGLFATRGIEYGELIAPARFFGMRTPAGRYTNHHPEPNAEALASGADILLVCIRKIPAGAEVLLNYRQVLAVNLASFDGAPER